MRTFLCTGFLLMLLGVVGPAFGQAPTWAVTPTDWEASMTVVGVYAPDGTASSNLGDRIAAFVGEKVRGVAMPVRIGAINLFFLTVHGHGTEGEITFAAYDALHAQVRPLSQRLTFTANTHIGSVATPFRWIPKAPAVASEPPAWATAPTLNPAAFEHSFNAVGEVFVDGAPQRHPNDRVGAFVAGELRGVARPQEVGGRMRYYLTTYGHVTDHNASVLLRYYDAGQGLVRTVSETMMFRSDAAYGLEAPLRWHAEHTGGSAPRWALTATPKEAVDPHAYEGSMNVIAHLSGEVGLGQRVAAFVGGEVRGVAETDAEGAVWMTVFGATADKGKPLSFYWWDQDRHRLHTLLANVVFNEGSLVGSPAQPLVLATDQHRSDGAEAWTVDTRRYANTMSVIARVNLNGTAVTSPEARVAAFAGNEVRGVASPIQGGAYAGYVFMTIHGESVGQALKVRVYNPATATVYETDAAFTFVSDAILGTVGTPLVWTAEAAHVLVFPGDADGNGQVDAGDVATIHTYFAATGPAGTPGGSGKRMSRPVWPGSPLAVHADTDASGRVDQNDVLLIGAHYGARTGGSEAADDTEAESVRWVIEPSATTVVRGKEVLLNLRVTGAPLGAGAKISFAPDAFELLDVAFGPGVDARLREEALLSFVRILEAPNAGVALALVGKRSVLVQEPGMIRIRLRVRPTAPEGRQTFTMTEMGARDVQATLLNIQSDPVTITLAASVAAEEVMLPTRTHLEAPAPNPLRGSGLVRFALDAPQRVHLAVYDVLGREVAVLVADHMSSGTHQVEWEDSGTAAGVYVLKLATEHGVLTRPFTVIR